MICFSFNLIFSFGCKPNCFISNIIVAEELGPVLVEEGPPVLSYYIKAGLLLGRLMKARVEVSQHIRTLKVSQQVFLYDEKR